MGTLQCFLWFEILGSRTSYGFALSLCNDDPEFILGSHGHILILCCKYVRLERASLEHVDVRADIDGGPLTLNFINEIGGPTVVDVANFRPSLGCIRSTRYSEIIAVDQHVLGKFPLIVLR
jgi:hypothetical protein